MIAYIYGIVDPLSKHVKYIGWTTKPIEKRLREHIKDSKHYNKTYKHHWINSIISAGLYPEIILLEEVEYEDRAKKEMFWISKYGRENLTNSTDGGEGKVGAIVSNKVKEHLSLIFSGKGNPFYGRKHTREVIEKLKNRNITEEQKAILRSARLGKKMPLEVREKIRNSLLKNPPFKGRLHSQESKEKNRKKHLGVSPSNKGVKTGIPSINRGKRKTGFIYAGVSKHNRGFCARVFYEGERIYLGEFPTSDAAAKAYDLGKVYFYKNDNQLNFQTDIEKYKTFFKTKLIYSVDVLRKEIRNYLKNVC